MARQDEPGPKGDIARKMKENSATKFDTADTNRDARLSKEEVAKVSGFYTNNFGKHDKDKDGFPIWEKLAAAIAGRCSRPGRRRLRRP